MAVENSNVSVIECRGDGVVPSEVHTSRAPILLKGLVSDWPLVEAGLKSDEQAVDYLKQFYTDKTVVFYRADHDKQGRFFYDESYRGFDFESQKARLDVVLDRLLECKKEAKPDTYYVGSTTVDVCLPELRSENVIALGDIDPLVSIWIGNRSRVAAHFDAPDNIACCVAGKRRFTLFPIEQVKNLYVGPLEPTPSGQIISTVDIVNPDFESHPKYSEALKHSIVVDLEPGDAVFLPSMWWHHVESLSDFNILVNYWWRDAKRFMPRPMDVLHHAILSLRDLPQHEKAAWRELFDHYIFDEQEGKYEHVPESARGFLNPLDEMTARQLRSWLINHLNK